MYVHVLSLGVRYESKHKKSLTPLLGQTKSFALCVNKEERKQRPN